MVGGFGPDEWPLGELGERVRFHGKLSTQELAALFATMDVIASPNQPFMPTPGAFDGFPTASCVEASLAGVALVVSDELELNDELAKNLGLESLERLHEIVKSQIESQFGALTRQKVKRELLDRLDEAYKFEAPSKLVDAEFENIWRQVTNELEQTGKTFADEDTTEEEAREEYRRLAERRVRLGLVLAEIGEKTTPTYFVRNADCLRSADEIARFDLHAKEEVSARGWLPTSGPLRIGLTAGASCPNNLIEDVIHRILELRGEAATI